MNPPVRSLRVVLGDQLDRDGPAVRDAEPGRDVMCMAEVAGEIRRFPNHRARVVLFLAAMRHFRDDMRRRGLTVDYRAVGGKGDRPYPDAARIGSGGTDGSDASASAPGGPDRLPGTAPDTLAEAVDAAVRRHRPKRLVVTRPGRFDLIATFEEIARLHGIPFELREDDHFLCDPAEFDEWLIGRRSPVMEHFYRWMRRRTGLLMDGNDPAGGRWNLDRDNRRAFGAAGPPEIPETRAQVSPHVLDVIGDVDRLFPDLPGSTADFAWFVTPDEAEQAADAFFRDRLAHFGDFQDAMWTGRPFLFHARLAAALNLKLIGPLDLCRRAEAAYRAGEAPLNAVEGFVRQVIGWREYVRGLYWARMPEYADANALEAHEALPSLFWTGDTRMRCMKEVVGQLLETGYAHHIQRLMVAGLFALLYGIRPREVHDWFMAYYVDSVEWVTLPNVLGMALFADGGVLATKPYAASGQYIDRMSNYCRGCPFDPKRAHGDEACPFTTLYWSFLDRHRDVLSANRRMTFQIRNLERKSPDELAAIAKREARVREALREGRL